MRISGGKARGVALRVDKKATHRPAMDRLRQSVFSSLGAAVDGARVLDLYAGTGSYGLEALSRGAAHATFVEQNKRAVAMIRDNLAIVAKSMQAPRLDAELVAADATRWGPGPARFDLIFVDPPYDQIEAHLSSLFALFEQALALEGLVIFECPGQLEPRSPGWKLRKRLGKGFDQPTACGLERARGSGRLSRQTLF